MHTLLLAALATSATVGETYPANAGFQRVDGDAFGSSLTALELREASQPVHTHDGDVVAHKAHVIDLPMVPGDLQQCADSVIRVRAEWLRSQGVDPMFHATSGDPLPWVRFRDGETPTAPGNRIVWTTGSSGKWSDWLSRVFTWAGTDSLARLDTRASVSPRPGDLLVEGGFPGHAVLILDVATRGSETRLLVAEGYMPAQDFHIELGPHAGWWSWDAGLTLPHWTFTQEHLRAFRKVDEK